VAAPLPQHLHKDVWGGGVQLHVTSSELHAGTRQLHATASLTPVPSGYEARRTPDLIYTNEYRESNPCCPASCFTDYDNN
jgi:hypothetical protein